MWGSDNEPGALMLMALEPMALKLMALEPTALERMGLKPRTLKPMAFKPKALKPDTPTTPAVTEPDQGQQGGAAHQQEDSRDMSSANDDGKHCFPCRHTCSCFV